MPRPETDEQRLLLREVWEFLGANRRWPTFDELDRTLYRNHDLRPVEEIIDDLPAGLLSSPIADRSGAAGDSREVALTVAAVEATGQGKRELRLFLSVVTLAHERERQFEPPADQPDALPTLTGTTVADHLGLRNPNGEALLARVGALLQVEPWGWTTTSKGCGSDWEFAIGRNVRRFRSVANLPQYWALRDRPSRYIAPYATSLPPETGRGSAAISSEHAPAESANSHTPLAAATQLAVAVVAAVFGGIAADRGVLSTMALIGTACVATLAWWLRPKRRPWRRSAAYPMLSAILVATVLAVLAIVAR